MQEKKRAVRSGFYKFVTWFSRFIFTPIYFVRVVKGKNTLPNDGPAIIASNHISDFDPILQTLLSKRQIHWMAKEELFKYWPIGSICRKMGAFPVSRGNSDIASIRKALAEIASGKVFGIYIEGHRYQEIDLEHALPGGVMIAHKSGAPIYPCACYTKRKNKLRIFCRYSFAVGKPITTADLGIIKGNSAELKEGAKRLLSIIKDLQDECAAARSWRPKKLRKKFEAEKLAAEKDCDNE